MKQNLRKRLSALDSGHDYRVYPFIVVRYRAAKFKEGGIGIWHYKLAKFIAARMQIAAARLP